MKTSPSPLNLSHEDEPAEILFLDFYREVGEADTSYVRGLILHLFGELANLKIENDPSGTSIIVSGDNEFQINRLRDAFDNGVDRVKRGFKEHEPLAERREFFPLKPAPDAKTSEEFIQNALRDSLERGAFKERLRTGDDQATG